jgi:hypothetical protein
MTHRASFYDTIDLLFQVVTVNFDRLIDTAGFVMWEYLFRCIGNHLFDDVRAICKDRAD